MKISKNALRRLCDRFAPVAAAKPVTGLNSKGGKTTNFTIPDWMFEREMKEANYKTN